MKTCKKCNQTKSFEDFYKHKFKTIYRPVCKKCTIESQLDYYKKTYVKSTKEKVTKEEQLKRKREWMRNYRRKKAGLNIVVIA